MYSNGIFCAAAIGCRSRAENDEGADGDWLRAGVPQLGERPPMAEPALTASSTTANNLPRTNGRCETERA